MPKAKYKNPKGGLSAAGRRYYKRTEGANLKPGVKNYSKASEADKKRWVRWALRFAGRSTIPPLRKPNGEPTRFALMFTAWGEPVPSSVQSVRKVYQKALRRRDQLGMGKAAKKKKINAEDKTFSLNREEINFSSVKIDVESGNPYRDPNTGKFSFGIPGVRFYAGLALFKNLPKGTKDLITQRILAFGGNVVGLRQTGDKVNVVVLKDGRLLGKFSVDVNSQVVRTEQETSQENVETNFSSEEKDAIIDAARDLDLNDQSLKNFLTERLSIEIDEQLLTQLAAQVENQRIDDLISYLDSNMVRKSEESNSRMVRIRAPRGYLRKIFSILDENQVSDIIQRLQAKGWDDSQVNSEIVEKLPTRLKQRFATEGENEQEEDTTAEG